MREILTTVIAVLIATLPFSSCGERKMHEQSVLGEMDSLLESNPDSAYRLLRQAKPIVDSIDNSALKMRYRLYLASAKNKLFLEMPSDSAFIPVVEYYEHHGSANDCIKASYLLGCIYRDKGEAPKALEYYQKAIEQADTTETDCDYISLMSVCGQMAEIYSKQLLIFEAIEQMRQYSNYALLADDTYNYIRGIELQIPLYSMIKCDSIALELTDSCYTLYKKNQMDRDASSVFPTAIYIYLEHHEYPQAKVLMDKFRNESGLFDEHGTIEKHRVHYNYAEGLYYLGIGREDSAEFFFRKLLPSPYQHDACRGMLQLKSIQAENDSLLKYARMLDESLLKEKAENRFEAVSQASAMYKYERLQQLADKNAAKAEKERLVNGILSLLFLLMVAISYLIVSRYRKTKQRQLERMSRDYDEVVKEMNQESENLRVLRNSYAVLEKHNFLVEEESNELSKEMELKKRKINDLKANLVEKDKLLIDIQARNSLSKLRNSQEVQFMQSCLVVKPNVPAIIPEKKHWDNLEDMTQKTLPFFYEEIKTKLTHQELCAVILLILDFSECDLASLLCVSINRISNIKSSINRKLFKTNSAKSLIQNLKGMKLLKSSI